MIKTYLLLSPIVKKGVDDTNLEYINKLKQNNVWLSIQHLDGISSKHFPGQLLLLVTVKKRFSAQDNSKKMWMVKKLMLRKK